MTHATETTRTRDGGKRSLWLILAILAIVAIAALAMFMSNNGRDEGEAVEGATSEVTTNIDAAPATAGDTASSTGEAVENAAAATGEAAQNAAEATGAAVQNAGEAAENAAAAATDGDPDSNNNEPAR